MSTYIFERAPNQYGGQQQAFVDASNAIVKNTTNLFRNASATHQDLIQLFYSTLAFFGVSRNHIAVSHGTTSASDFGVRRDQLEGFEPFISTTLGIPYSEYNKRLLPVIHQQLKTMEQSKHDYTQTKSQVSFDPCLGRGSSMDYSILNHEPDKWEFEFTDEDYQRICELSEVSPMDNSFEPVLSSKEAMLKLREKSPNDYRRLKLLAIISKIVHSNFCPLDQLHWIHVSNRFSLNDKIQDLSEYLICNRYGRRGPIVTILHQDSFLIETMLDDIAKVFKNIIEWNGKNLRDLKDQVALFRYEFSHAMPFKRGSSAVAEWFERAIYGFHGLNVSYNSDKLVDLEALTSPLKEFVDNYDSMIKLTKLEDNSSEPKIEL